MTVANRNLGTDQPYPKPTAAFNPGGDDFAVVRMIDGHDPSATGEEGSNVHQPSSSASPEWHDEFSQYDPDDD